MSAFLVCLAPGLTAREALPPKPYHHGARSPSGYNIYYIFALCTPYCDSLFEVSFHSGGITEAVSLLLSLKLKARTNTPTFTESALASELESADSSTCGWVCHRRPTLHNCWPTICRVGRLSLLNMLNILPLIESPDRSSPTEIVRLLSGDRDSL